jgi:AcrR family transcriptional regulator
MTTDTSPTKERLLDAAERQFAERGFEGVSIRDLAGEAGVNVAAVNYHFQSKINLYQEVLLRRLRPLKKRMLAAIERVDVESDGRPQLDALIRAFVTEYLHDALAGPQGETFLRLMVREMHDPRHGGQVFFTELVLPVHQAFATALAYARPDLTSDTIRWIIASIIGQVMHFILRWRRSQARVLEGTEDDIPGTLFPPLRTTLNEYIHNVVEHVTRFSVGGIGPIKEPEFKEREHG